MAFLRMQQAYFFPSSTVYIYIQFLSTFPAATETPKHTHKFNNGGFNSVLI